MGFFHTHMPHHPRRTPAVEGELSFSGICSLFQDCADFSKRTLTPEGWTAPVHVCWLDGMVRTERLNDYVLRPLSLLELLEGETPAQAVRRGIWCQSITEQENLNDTAEQLLSGSCALFLPDGVLTCFVETEEKRSVSQPDNENEVKGAKDSFVEAVRTNTSLIRRRMHSPFLKVRREVVGRQTMTPVELLWLDNICDPALPKQIAKRLETIDEEGLLTTAELEEYLASPRKTSFPRMLFTERPDRACQGLLEGRVVLLADGIPLACLLPADISQFIRAPQDRSYQWLAAGALNALRWLCMMVTLLLPGFYAAVATFHIELIPTQLAISIIASEQDVPFPVVFEVVGMLIAFEILQEAGLRLPKTIGQTVSIIGGLVVGEAAVEAKIVSPAVVIVVAVAGITGFTIPNQDFANALRLWRLGLTALSSLLGIFGLTLGGALLITHLSGLEEFGVPYLSRTKSQRIAPLKEAVLRPSELNPQNRRRQW